MPAPASAALALVGEPIACLWLTGLGALVGGTWASAWLHGAGHGPLVWLAGLAGILAITLTVRLARRVGTLAFATVTLCALITLGSAVVSQHAATGPANRLLDATLRRLPGLDALELRQAFDLGHVVAFCALTALVLGLRRALGVGIPGALGGLGLLALGIEAVQLHLVDRSALLGDVKLDVLGMGAGGLAWLAWRIAVRRAIDPQPAGTRSVGGEATEPGSTGSQ